MKLKKEKKAAKRELQTDSMEKGENNEEPARKVKVVNGDCGQETNVVASTSTEKTMPTLHTSIFQHFSELTNEEEQTRMEAALHLLQQLSKTKEAEKREKELSYTLKRLIRGCGASTNASRAGFFTGLVAFLKIFNTDEVSLEQIFTTIKKELHVGSTITNKEDAGAVVGKILSCAAVLHAGRVSEASHEQLEKIANILLQSTRHRMYHASLGYTILIELMQACSLTQFETSVWPLLQKELIKPWPKQTLQTIHCLIAAQKQFPSLVTSKFLKTHFGGPELLNEESFQYLHKIFWDHSNTNVLTHPAFEMFGVCIANCGKLGAFWTECVDPGLQTPTKLLEVETLKIITDVLNNLNVEKTNVADLLSANFLKMLIEGLKTLKQKKDETLKAFYDEFLEALVACCAKLPQDTQKVAVIRRLIMPPGVFCIEKYTSTRFIHQLINYLGEQGVVEIFQVYKSIFLATQTKNAENPSEHWLNFERLNAGYMLQHLLTHKSVKNAQKWRAQQLQFFMVCGVFHVTDGTAEICKKESAGMFSKDFGEQCKNMFYTSLHSKLHDMEEQKQLLLSLVHYCNEKLQQKNAVKFLKIKTINATMQKAWNSMLTAVEEAAASNKSKKKKGEAKKNNENANKLQLVFHILLMNMGLQLFREPEMAAPAIDDLLMCMQRNKEQKPQKLVKGKVPEQTDEEAEPEWIEVVVDLFLHLLSLNANALRNVVNELFPHLCDNMNISAVHQILNMLDMKDGHNPLSAKGEEEEEEAGEEEEEKLRADNVAGKDSDTEQSEDNDSDADDDEENDEEDDDEDDDDEEDVYEEDEGTVTDKLRNAISQVLIESSGAGEGVDDDMESVDLNNMTEEEGRRLDEALANAFRAMKKPSGSSQEKKTKSYRVQVTTVMHFRIRVLDLIEIYLQQKPTLLISIEIMLALFNMLEYCVADELKQLQAKVEKVLTKLTSLRTFAPDSMSEETLVSFISLIVEKKTPTLVFDLTNKLRNKCVVFLIANANKLTEGKNGSKVIALCQEYLTEFINSRNPTANITLFSDLFKLRWPGNWELANTLAHHGISMQTRTFRRIQTFEILAVLYRNNELQKLNEELTKKQFKRLEKALIEHIAVLAANTTVKQSMKEFQTLLELLLHAQKANARLNINSALSSEDTCENMQQIRRHIRLESSQTYQRYCAAFKLKVIRNNTTPVPVHEQNGSAEMEVGDVADADADADAAVNGKRKQKKQKKSKAPVASVEETDQPEQRKHSSKESRKEKKLKKQERMLAASKGLNGYFGFANTNGAAMSEDDGVEV